MLYQETKNNVIKKLKGNFGFKRYIRDGFKTVNESPSRRYELILKNNTVLMIFLGIIKKEKLKILKI